MYSKYFFIIVSAVNFIQCSFNDEDALVNQGSEEITEINEMASADEEELDKDSESGNTDSKTENDVSAEFSTNMPVEQGNITSFQNSDIMESGDEEDGTTMEIYPYSASIQKKGVHYATGALISNQHVLTVAAEFYHVRETKKLFRVRLGSVDCKRSGEVVPIKTIVVHPSFKPGRPSFDLGLVQLAKQIKLTDYIKPIPLSTVQQGVTSAVFLMTYWPRLIIHGKIIPKTANERLKYNSMRITRQGLIPWKTCSDMMKTSYTKLDNTSLCLKPIKTYHSVCMPDVGAPIVADDSLWGITSGWTSKHCTKNPSPTIFTRTSPESVRDWLKESIDASMVSIKS